MKTPPSNQNPWRAAGLVSAIGVDFAVCILAGFFGGRWVGEKLGGHPIFTAIGVVLGIIIGIVSIVFMIRKFLEDENG